MEDFSSSISQKVTDTFKDLVKTETVIGKEFNLGEYSVVPAIRVSVGFGTAGGTSNEASGEMSGGGGGGGGMNIEPIAFLVSRGSEINLLSLGKGAGLEAFIGCLPKVIDKTAGTIEGVVKKITEKKEKKEESEENEEKNKQ